jgi:hypothetical protein
MPKVQRSEAPTNMNSIENVIHQGIRRGIEVLIEQKCYRSALVLIYAGIEAMAFLDRPENQQDVHGRDFIAWTDKYIRFPCSEQLTGLELYGARCGVLHSFSPVSRLSREQQEKCRLVGYMTKGVPEVRYKKRTDPSLVIVSITGLAEAFFKGVERFKIEKFANPLTAPLAKERLKTLFHSIPLEKSG